MSRIVIAPNDLGTAAVTLTSPNVNTDVTISLPAVAEDATLLSNLDNMAEYAAFNALFFSAYAVTDQVVVTNVDTKITLAGEEIDTFAQYDPVLSRFVATHHGGYMFTGAGRVGATTSLTVASFNLKVNGAVARRVLTLTDTSSTLTFAAPVYLRRNDYVELWATVTGTGTLTHLVSGGTAGEYGARLAGSLLALDADQT